VSDTKTVKIDPSIEIAELQLRMQAQIDFLANRVLVLAQLLTNAEADKTDLAGKLAEVTALLEEASIPIPEMDKPN
jgi:hypothetical protein